MNRRTVYLGLTVVALLGSSGLTARMYAQQGVQIAPVDGVLLLTNGQALHGKITHAGDHYIVALQGGEIRLKSIDVELVCANLDAAYQHKRNILVEFDVQAHLDLAQWCIRYQLFDAAARELSDARKLEPQHPKIPLLERRLLSARVESETQIAEPPAAKGVSNDELDRLVRSLPEGTVDTFTHTIQPLLLNTCTTAGCHGPNSSTNFSLLRLQLGRTPSRRLTQRNLHAAIEQIDRAQPAASPLLTVPLREHGGRKSPIFTSHELTQYRQLVAWVYRVSRSSVPADALPTQTVRRTDERSETLLQPAMPNASTPSTAELLKSAVVGTPLDGDASPRAETKADNSSLGKSSNNGAPYKPVDPFDPEIFNRRHHPTP